VFIRCHFNEDTVTDGEMARLQVLMEAVSSAGGRAGISEPPDTYVLLEGDLGQMAAHVESFPLQAMRVLITDIVTLEWSQQPMDPESDDIDKVLTGLVDMGLPIVKHGWPQTPKQGIYRDKDHLHGVVYLHSLEEGSHLRLVVRVEGLAPGAALRFYADILAGSIQPLAQWDDTFEIEGVAIMETPVSI
jgi:hypothetical protein